MMNKIILFFVGLLGFSGAQINQLGRCSGINLVNDFDLQLFFGTWYEIGKISSESTTCSTLEFSPDLTSGISVINLSVINNFQLTDNGNASHSYDGNPVFNLFMESGSTNFWILDTDYSEFTIAISCYDLGLLRRTVGVWQLGRTLNSFDTEEVVERANAALQAIGVSLSDLQNVDHSTEACAVFPEIEVGTPIILPGQCSTINPVQNFEMANFTGTWHEIASYYWENAVGGCARVDYTLTGTRVEVVHSRVLNQELDTITGTATLDTDGSGKLSVVLVVEGVPVPQELYIIDTDYNEYAVTYICKNVGTDHRRVYSWILSRTQQTSAQSQTEVDRVINSFLDLNTEYFQDTPQTSEFCFYYPDFQDGVPVVFPGQCDMNIAVQIDFDPTQYVNWWHDIESYPSTFQQGTCNNAFYTLTPEGTVDVFNTQVIDERLDTMRGIAVIPDATQPAKLRVTFPVGDTGETVSTDYWVLATDYFSYSLVYTCRNLANNRQAVFSWKLSRGRDLTNEAHQAMDAVIASIPVLDSRYFSNRNQTVGGCFYFPEPVPGMPVVFPGYCDNAISAMSDFNLTSFTGLWHEIEAYPKEQQSGSCINHEFTFSTAADTLDMVSNEVVNYIDTSAFSTVTIDSTDGSAVLVRITDVNGEPVAKHFWILDTDYTDYALVYGCTNLNVYYKSIQSLKLSRTQTLSTEAITSINNAMAAVQVLENEYFEEIDQSEEGCLTYPTIPAGDPIILQGQCGTVSPVSNFQADNFTGTWFELARYASERQSGNCAAQELSTADQNDLTLTQTVIYNERLTTVSGPATLAADGTGVLTATLSDGAGLSYSTTIYILDTDYDQFAVLYSCENLEDTNNRQIYSWKLSRTQTDFTEEANDRISEVVANNFDLNEDYFQITGQSNNDCFYYPVFEETPEAIILPGTCPSILGMTNFTLNDYLGNWYDAASYPTGSEDGVCSRTEYSPGFPFLNIRHSMVVDGHLKTQHAEARAFDDPGMMVVLFTSENGVEREFLYHILDTDYISYALIYSCRNLENGARQVFSWKLSRTPTLTPEASAVINGVISNTQGLLEEYYSPISQSAEDCFYVPEYVPGQSVLFRGACGAVTGMQGFDANQYLGWWNEIERYPGDNVSGHCTSAHFMQTSNGIQVVESSINSGVSNESTSNALLSSDGTITIQRSEGPIVWHVLDTDYNSYSLLYACEDVTTDWGDYRRVWSAKHSKAPLLTQAAQDAMDPVIAANELLHPQFYEIVDQSEAACLHYREEVIIPGQCDTRIPVQEDFDISQFAGTWYQLERYPYPQVSNEGTCVGASYTVDGSLIYVLNWEVLDGTLNRIRGLATVDSATATLKVTLGAETMDLRILATDYDDYALAYTCVNVNSFERSVGAFKLSRSRAMSSEGQHAIETYMANREELHHHFFITVEQHDECPSSALLLKSSVIIMLICFALHLVM